MSLDVLFVDDDLELARVWALHIAESLSLTARALDNPQEAIALVSDEAVRVVVIDQRMPRMTGIDLGTSIRAIDPRCRQIMMSGEASNTEVSGAYDSGFDRFIHKNEAISKLPGTISQLLLEYYTEIDRERRAAAPKLAFIVSSGPPWRRSLMQFSLLSIDNTVRDFVISDSWTTPVRLDAGVSIEKTIEVAWSASSIETTSINERSRAKGQLGLPFLKKFSASLESELSQNQSFASNVTQARTHRISHRYELPSEPQNPDELHVKARSYQVAPAYLRLDLSLAAHCVQCSIDEIWKVHTLVPSRRYATQQIDHLSDGTERTSPTGFNDF